MLGLGVGLYLFYILWIGGDFMSGRYFSIALLISAVLLVQAGPEYWPDVQIHFAGRDRFPGLSTPPSPVSAHR